MTHPRPVLPGQSYMVTRRCTQRQFLMRPDDETNQAFEYCLAVAAEKFGISLYFSMAMSNHHHTGIFDRDGRYPEFLEYFHKLFAKCQNALRGRTENFWSNEQTSVVRLVDDDDVLAKLVYAVTNPVNEHLVERAIEWPGVTSYHATLAGNEKTVRRPGHFFRDAGPMPETATLRFVRPQGFEHFSQVDWRALIERKVSQCEARVAAERRESNVRVVGRRGILAQRWDSKPKAREVIGGLSPRVAAKNTWRRIEALKRNRRFLEAYRAAKAALAAGYNYVFFPEGTYWVARFLRVVCEIQPADVCLAS